MGTSLSPLAELVDEPFLSLADFVHHLAKLLVFTAELFDFAAELADDFAGPFWRTFGPRPSRPGVGIAPLGWTGGMRSTHDCVLACSPVDLLSDLFGLIVESGRVEVLHGNAEVVDSHLQFGRRSGPLSFARRFQAAAQFL